MKALGGAVIGVSFGLAMSGFLIGGLVLIILGSCLVLEVK